MNPRKLSVILVGALLLTLAALAAGPGAAAPQQTLDWFVIGGGGGSAAGGASALDGTIGQPIASTVSADLCSGFWCGVGQAVANLLYVYLPLAMR